MSPRDRRRRDATALLLACAVLGAAGCGSESRATAESGASAPDERATRTAQRVRVATVARGRVGGLSEVAGVTSAFRTATVAAEVAARVVERHVEPGARVEAGYPLVTLDDARLSIAVDEGRATLKAREVDLAEARKELARGDELRRQGALSEGQHDALRFATERAESARDLARAALRRAQVALDDSVVRAPFGGTVDQIEVQVGDYLAPGTPIATVADFSRIRLRAGVTAEEAAGLEPGMRGSVSIRALGGYATDAEIASVGRIADPSNGTYPVEVWLDNPDDRLRSGMVAQLHLDAPEDSTAVVVPRSAILRRDGVLSVFVVEGDAGELRAHARSVRIGRQQAQSVELLEGVVEGERVVVDGLFTLTDGAAVYVDEAPGREETAWNG